MVLLLPQNVIDTHVHFWHPDKVRVPWLSTVPKFNCRMDAEKYSREVEAVKVRHAVYVETDVEPTLGLVEADWIRHYAEQLSRTPSFGGIEGIVAYAPVHLGKHVRSYLDLLVQLVGTRLRGVRYLIQDPSLDPKRVSAPAFVEGVQTLASYGLSFDLNINCHAAPEQFPPLLDLVSQCPRVQFVLDHMGKPPCDSRPGDEPFEFWRTHMMALAQFDNVSCKVSGLVTEGEKRTAEQLAPFVQVAREAFGIDRLMFGGDWPVCELAERWQTWIELLSEIVSSWSEQDKNKLFVENAARVYRLHP